MAGIKHSKIVSARLPASTLVEVITAIVIISAVFGLSIIIYVNVQRSGFSGQRVKAEIRLHEVLRDSTLRSDLTLKFDDMTIVRSTRDMLTGQNFLEVTAEAWTLDGRLLAERKRVIYVEPE